MNVTKTYYLGDNAIEVLKGIDINIAPGELVAIMGASGSGKSTMMNIIGLLDNPTSGQYYLNNKEVSSLSSDDRAVLRNEAIGFVFQSFFLLPRLTAIQNVGLPLTYRNVPSHEIKERAHAVLQKMGVAHLSGNKPYEMSGGQQQRIAIARALIGQPSIILADEPTGALDSKTGQDVMNLLIELNKSDKATIVIVTHDIRVANQCKRMIEIADGKIINH